MLSFARCILAVQLLSAIFTQWAISIDVSNFQLFIQVVKCISAGFRETFVKSLYRDSICQQTDSAAK